LSRLRGKIISTDSLSAWAKDLNIVLERGPRSPKKSKAPSGKELADAVEALLAAVVLDSEASGEGGLADDGLANALKIIEARFGNAINTAGIGDWEQDDPKTALQERAAAMGLEAPVYELIERSGPEHAPVFCCSVKVGKFEAVGKGSTLKRAHMEAARLLLALL
jgi:ribonuclease-3